MLFDESYGWKEFHVATRGLADSGKYSFVVVTDIADFYPSVYLHHLETVLYDAVSKSGRHAHAKFLLNYVREMNDSQTHRGLPIGPVFAAPLVELVLDEIDRVLIEDGIPFTRFVDDLRLFCTSEGEAYQKLAYLSQILYEQRNFKLNEQKTSILSVDEFLERYTQTHEDRKDEGIMQNLEDLLGELGIEANFYVDVDVDSLDDSDLDKVAELNLEKLLKDELGKEHVDYQFLSFLLGSLAKFDNSNAVDTLLAPEHVRTLLPRMRSLVGYLNRLRSLPASRRNEIGRIVLERSTDPIIGALPFNRAWLFSLFAESGQWGCHQDLSRMASVESDPLTRRELLLAVGRVRDASFFRRHKNLEMDADPWVRRAFLAGMSCLPKEERVPWYKARKLSNLDELDRIIIDWSDRRESGS